MIRGSRKAISDLAIQPGQQFGRFTVLAFNGRRHRKALFQCRCVCGTEHIVIGSHLLSGHSQSCGCLRRERTVAAVRRHGQSRSMEYRIWAGMQQRCLNSRNPCFRYYGGRGIHVCQRWLDSFESFLNDVGPRPTPQHTIDRIDNDGDYEPGNVRWATRRQQRLNSRKPVRLRALDDTDMRWLDAAHYLAMPEGTFRGLSKRALFAVAGEGRLL